MESGIGDSWLIGDDTTSKANAYATGGCEPNLVIPHNLTDESGNTKNVEVIGQYAFCTCGIESTHSIVLSRYIKVIKPYGLGGMVDVTSFRIEEGSCLESIEEGGLSDIGSHIYNNNYRSILVLPSTVTNIEKDGLLYNDLIKTIYCCGSTHLNNYSQLTYVGRSPDIKVTRSYNYDTIFGRYTPKNDSSSIAEAEEICNKYKPEASPSSYPSHSASPLLPSPQTEASTILSKYSKFFAANCLIKS